MLRCLRWVLTNKPSGANFIGKWRKAPYALGKLTLDNGKTILRKRGKSSNYYKLSGKLLKAFGHSVPQRVSDLANVGDVNFQGQLDAPFWFSLSPAEVSRNLNSIINLSSIDAALAKVVSKVRRAKTVVEITKERLQEAKREKAETVWAVQLSSDLEALDLLILKAEKIRTRSLRINDLAVGIARAAQNRDRSSGMILDAATCIAKITTTRRITDKLGKLESRVETIRSTEILSSIRVPDVHRLVDLDRREKALTLKIRKLTSLWNGISSLEYTVKEATQQIKVLRSQSKIKVCRLCKQPLKQSHIPSPSCAAIFT